MNRLTQILTILLIVQIILIGIVFWPRTTSAGAEVGPLLEQFDPADVVGLTITDGDGNRITLARNDGDWVLANAGDYPVDETSITPLLEKIRDIETNRLITRTEASHGRLKVAQNDYNRLVEIQLDDGATHKLYLGTSAGGNTAHVRAADSEEVYLTNDLSGWDVNAQASNWIDTLYFTVPQTATISLTLENPNGSFEFEKEGEEWTMKGLAEDEKFNSASFTSLLAQASSIRMTSPIGKEEQASFELDEPQAVVTLETKEGEQEKTYSFRIGARNEEDNTYVASSSESPYYVYVAEFTGNNLIDKGREDFLELPPTPAFAPDAETTQ